jgi:hypothetical protein
MIHVIETPCLGFNIVIGSTEDPVARLVHKTPAARERLGMGTNAD